MIGTRLFVADYRGESQFALEYRDRIKATAGRHPSFPVDLNTGCSAGYNIHFMGPRCEPGTRSPELFFFLALLKKQFAPPNLS